jgi:acetyl esterase/lipase
LRTSTRLLLRLPGAWLLRLAGGTPLAIDGRTLQPAFQLLQAMAARHPHLASLPVDRMRRACDASMKLLGGRPRILEAIESRAIPGPGGSIPLRVYRPRGLDDPAPLLLFFHQGGYVVGNLDWCHPFCTILADGARCLVVPVAYRRAPEHRFPAAAEDALAAWSWVRHHATEIGGDPERLAVGGESAGGSLAAFLTHEAKRAGGPHPILQLLLFPWVAARATTRSYESFARAWPIDPRLIDRFLELALEKPEDARDPRLNPLLAPSFSGLPPALVFTAGFDPLCDEGKAYADALAAAGVPVRYRCFDALPHSFTAMGAVPAAARAQREIAEEVGRLLRGG